MDRLKYDEDTDVREASAWALGAIGDPRSSAYLDRAAVYDKKQAVRNAASSALRRIAMNTPPPSASMTPESGPATIASPPPAQSGGAFSPPSTPSYVPAPPPAAEDLPPPDPTPTAFPALPEFDSPRS